MASGDEKSLVIFIPPTVYTAYRSCENVKIGNALQCIGNALYQHAGAVMFNQQLRELVVFVKSKEDEFKKALNQCCLKKCHCGELGPAYRFETAREVVWDFISFRLMFRK